MSSIFLYFIHKPRHKIWSEMTKPVSLYSRPGDLLIVLFFTFHIPITLLFASQVILGPELGAQWVPSWASSLLQLAAESSNDPLLSMALPGVKREPWAIAIFYGELFFQLPLFFYLGSGYCVSKPPFLIWSWDHWNETDLNKNLKHLNRL
jgi:hypothetical protein